MSIIDVHESRLHLLHQIRCMTISKQKIQSSFDVIISVLTLVCKTFNRKPRMICENSLNKLTSQMRSTNTITACDRFELLQLILYMKKVIITEDKLSHNKPGSCLSKIKCLQPKICEHLKKISKVKDIVRYLFCAVSKDVCNRNFRFSLTSIFPPNTSSPKSIPWKEGLDLINDLYNTCCSLNTNYCFHNEASSLILLFNRNQWTLNQTVYRCTLNIAHMIGTKILKSIVSCCEDPEVYCNLLIQLINFLIKIEKGENLTADRSEEVDQLLDLVMAPIKCKSKETLLEPPIKKPKHCKSENCVRKHIDPNGSTCNTVSKSEITDSANCSATSMTGKKCQIKSSKEEKETLVKRLRKELACKKCLTLRRKPKCSSCNNSQSDSLRLTLSTPGNISNSNDLPACNNLQLCKCMFCCPTHSSTTISCIENEQKVSLKTESSCSELHKERIDRSIEKLDQFRKLLSDC